MDIIFYRSRDRGDQTIVTRQDGVRLSVPVFGPLDPIPHDLAHYVVERALELDNGFWASVADGALFGGMRVLDGRQRPHARERSQAIVKANQGGVLFAELAVSAVMRAIEGMPIAEAAHALAYHLVGARTSADGAALLKRLLPPVEAIRDRWRTIPLGAPLLVVWPDRSPRAERAAHREHPPRPAPHRARTMDRRTARL